MYICWLVLPTDSFLINNENYYLQLFLKECKYTEKKLLPLVIPINLVKNKLIIIVGSLFKKTQCC